MTVSDAVQLAALLLGLYAVGFGGGYIINVFRRFLEQI